MTPRSLRTKIVLGFMGCIGVSVLAFSLLVFIGFQFRAAEAVSRDAVENSRTAAGLEQRADGAKVALYRYLYSVEAGDRQALDAGLREIGPATSGGAALVEASKKASDLIQRSQGAAVGLFDSSGNLTPSLVTLAELAAALPDPTATLLVSRVNQAYGLVVTNLGRLVSLGDARSGDAIKDDAQRMVAALAEIQALPIATARVKKVAGVASRDTDALSAAVGSYRTLMAERAAAMASLTKAFDVVAEELKGRLDRSSAAFTEASQAVDGASSLMMTSLLVAATAVVLLGIVLALAVGRSISRPIIALTRTMGRLADADYAVEVSGKTRGDEIGAMARAVEVFKSTGLSLLAKEREASETRAVAEAERARNDAAQAASAQEQAFVVAAIGSGLTQLAKGDLTCRLDASFPAEYRQVQSDFNEALTQLQSIVTTVVATAHGFESGTAEITKAADDLSRRTEQQAASLEQTAAALDEITATVRRTAESSNDARALMTTAREEAERSGAVVGDAVKAMGDIERSSLQIGQIIGVIDEIAFQTNLLALNAGVEAARAGEAGRGFAVVASEVRALAQRSASAAKEIKQLIGTSTQQVSQGVTLVGETGKALGQIVVEIRAVSETIATIAASAQEQATGLHEVNAAVNQMDQVTQQNAAMVEQSTAASHALSQEAQELSRLTARFTLGDRMGKPGDEAATCSGGTVVPLRSANTDQPKPPRAAAQRRSGRSTTGRALAQAEPAGSWEEF